METGSKLIGESVKIFNDAVKLGADPDTVGFLAADYSTKTIMLRAKRKVTASTFSWLTLVMHGAVSLLMVMIFEIVYGFAEMLEAVTANMDPATLQTAVMALPNLSTSQLELFGWMTIGMILIFSVINAFAINATGGGHKLKVAFFLSLMLFLSGLSLLAGPRIIESVL